MSVKLNEIVFTVTCSDLLSAIWYGDGSGANVAVPIAGAPDDFAIEHLTLFMDETIRITLKPRVQKEPRT